VDETSIVYEKPILAKESGIYNFKAYHPEYKSSKQISATLIKTNYSLATVETTIFPPAHSNYTANGPLSLVDFKKGSTQFRNGNEWLGFQSPMVTFNLDFPKRVEISKIIFTKIHRGFKQNKTNRFSRY
jgi:hexosaminidase